MGAVKGLERIEATARPGRRLRTRMRLRNVGRIQLVSRHHLHELAGEATQGDVRAQAHTGRTANLA